jgi:glutaredoxin
LEVQNLHCWYINFKTTLEMAEKHKQEEKNREADSTKHTIQQLSIAHAQIRVEKEPHALAARINLNQNKKQEVTTPQQWRKGPTRRMSIPVF